MEKLKSIEEILFEEVKDEIDTDLVANLHLDGYGDVIDGFDDGDMIDAVIDEE